MADPLPLLKGKITLPGLAEPLVPRERLSASITQRLTHVPVLVVCAAAGAGKTSAVRVALQDNTRLGWLTLDKADASPGRLLTYLAAALAPLDPTLPSLVRSTMDAGVPWAEVAGLLIEALAESGEATVVLDQVDRVVQSRSAMEILDALVNFLPSGCRLVLISRTAFTLPSGADAGAERIDYVIDRELAFTEQETEEALRLNNNRDSDPREVQRSTGGWVIGVLFAGTTSPRTTLSLQPEIDPLHAYLRSHILDQLDPELRDFLICTSLLAMVDADSAHALGVERPEALLTELRAHRMPVVWEPGGKTVRYHPVLRDYLQLLFGRLPQQRARELRLMYARLLNRDGFLIEATDGFLSLGLFDEALPSAEVAIFSLIERRDFAHAERWLELLAQHGEASVSPLTTAELMLAFGREEYWRGVRIADQLNALGQREALARSSGTAAAMMIWCYYHACRTEDIAQLMEVSPPGPEVTAAGALASLIGTTPPELPDRNAPGAAGGLAVRIQYWNGLLSVAAAPGSDDASDILTHPWRIAALRAMGDLDTALELYRRVEAAGMLTSGLLGVVGTELFTDLGLEDEAREASTRGIAEARAAGSRVWELFGLISLAKLELRLKGDAAAGLAVLKSIEELPEARRYASTAEHLDTWFGYAYLLLGQDVLARERLRAAVASMRASGRRVELPTAAVYLAEAEWRAGDEDTLGEVLELAAHAARTQESDTVLLRALREFPDVLSRQLDGLEAPHDYWNQLGSRVLSQSGRKQRRASVRVSLNEFGPVEIAVDGTAVQPRIAKCAELLAFLASMPGHTAQRHELLSALFDGKDTQSSRSYLRQVVHQLRSALPEGVGPTLDDGVVSFGAEVDIVTASSQVIKAQQSAVSNAPLVRLKEIETALLIPQRGAFLAKATTSWAEDRRSDLEAIVASLRFEAARLNFDLGNYAQTESLAAAVVEADPLKESAWRLRMRAAAMLGLNDDVLAHYAACNTALAGVRAQPTFETRSLFEQLRR